MRVAHDCCDYEEASGNADQVVSTSDRKPLPAHLATVTMS